MLVGGVVVCDQMNCQALGSFLVDFLEESQPFLVPMLLGNGRDQFSLQVIERGKQRQGAMADVIVAGGFDRLSSR